MLSEENDNDFDQLESNDVSAGSVGEDGEKKKKKRKDKKHKKDKKEKKERRKKHRKSKTADELPNLESELPDDPVGEEEGKDV